ncbi:MAG TPA: ATP-binding cassette domain-containing protein [Candidatus Polarisedimenticolaceae bacterium]
MIRVDKLTKVYGSRVAVWRVSFEVKRGEILGFLGPNGAGKTTTMRMITGFIPPSSGTAEIAGYDVVEKPLEAKARIGYLCEAPPVYREMLVRDYLGFVAEIKRVPRARRGPLVDRAIGLCGLKEVHKRVIGNLSKGYRQRVGLAQAILHEPPVLILDEPTVGLDPRQIIEIREVIKGLGGEQTVVLSTHILPEVTMTCSRVVIINAGQVAAEDTIENLTAGLGRFQTVRLRTAREVEGLEGRLRGAAGVAEVTREADRTFLARVESGDDAREALAAAAASAGAGVVELARMTASLEEIFLKLVTEEKEPAA